MGVRKILIVDDNKDISELLSHKLKSEGFNVSTLSEGQEVLKKAKDFMPDVILMDIVLGDIDGADCVRTLQEYQSTRDIPVIFLSGIVVEDEEETATKIKVGDRFYPAIGKPFNFKELMDKIKTIA
ncbi:MAG TPA: response regulator [Candidatus Omnitrophota bacterium]|nr:response regulator [Candidatus Omnitrophota bacterium]